MNAPTASSPTRATQSGHRPPGPVLQITSPANPRIKAIRALALKKHRDETGLFVAEGLKLLTDALDGGWPVDTVLYTRRQGEEAVAANAAARARAHGAAILEVSEKILSAVSRRDNPQTVIGVYAQRHAALPADPAPAEFWIGLDRVRDPGNLGTIIRTADCAGAAGVVLVGDSTDPFAIEAVRATMGSIFHVPVARAGTTEFAQWRTGWPGLVIGTHLAGSVDYRDIKTGDRPVLLLMGNEQQGLPDELARLCDRLCLIPMAGRADSLNLAVSTGILAFELRRDRLAMPASSATEPE